MANQDRDAVWMNVVETVSDRLDVDSMDLPPISDTLDPDSLSAMFNHHRINDDVSADISVQFDYAGFLVTVTGVDEISLVEQAPTLDAETISQKSRV